MCAIYLVLTLRSQEILDHPGSQFSAHLVNISDVTSEERRVISTCLELFLFRSHLSKKDISQAFLQVSPPGYH